jgi:signal transduction histidine kinase
VPVLLGAVAIAVVGILLASLFGPEGATQSTLILWAAGLSVVVLLLVSALLAGRFATRRVAAPLADVMAAADALAAGDLSARVPEPRVGRFRRLARSFNRMAEELEAADARRRQLTADVAHELRTPLHVIQGNLEGILDGVYEPTTEHIEATLAETRFLARLVEDLRTLSLAEAGQLPLAREPLDPAELVTDVATTFSGPAQVAGVDLRTEVAADLPPLTADPQRLEQVLTNLVANALRYTPRGGTITLGAQPIEGGARLTVRDTGEGIPPEDLPYVFDRFWRGDRSRSHADGAGVGLGLAIARQLAEAHGGRITAESTVGQGSTFTVDLPA